MSQTGRNDPCPCGSGKKYKKCCLPLAVAAPRPAQTASAPTQEHFTIEYNPRLEDEVDRLLQRFDLGERGKLKDEIGALLAKHPIHHLTNYAMGTYLLGTEDDIEKATSYLEKAVKIFPPFVEGHFNLGSCYIKAGDIGKAVASYRAVIRHDGAKGDIAAMARKKLKEIHEIIAKASPFKTIEEYVANQELFDGAFAALSKKKFEKAAQLFNRVLENNPNHVQSYGNLGLAYAGLGQKALALECFDKALALDPEYEPARNNRHIAERMTEGEPQQHLAFGETSYYRDLLEARKNPENGSWWDRLKFWKR